MKQKVHLIFVFLLTFSINSFAQNKETVPHSNPQSKAIKNYEKALKLYEGRKDKEAIDELNKAKEKDSAFVETYILLANIYYEARQNELAIAAFKKSFEINPQFFPNSFFTCARMEFGLGRYEEAKKHYEDFLKSPSPNPKMKAFSERDLLSCDFAIKAIKNPVPFEPKNLGPAINSVDAEYFPAITADDQTMIITRNKREDQSRSQEDFYISYKVKNEWMAAENIGQAINTPGNEGAPTISADGTLLLFSACDRINGNGSCDIYYSQRIASGWTKPKNIGAPISAEAWDTQPTFSSDGKTLYFVSNRKGGFGGGDIWKCVLSDQGTWSTPVNLGERINTSGNEESPFIHQDTKTLYFSSDGHIGMGSKDIYYAKKNDKDEWATPVNLGYPINTYNDEGSLLVNASGDVAYFSSDREGGYGSLDLYSFDLYDAARPERVNYVKGKVYDKDTKEPLDSRLELIDLSTGNVIISSFSDRNSGAFLVSLPVNNNYALNVSRTGYLFYSENFSLQDDPSNTEPFLLDVPLSPIKVGEKVVLKNIFFETASYALKNASKAELNKLIVFLQKNPTVNIEISGHTDNVGDKKSNQALSQNRAKAVYDFLIAAEIPVDRLSYKGFGDTKPVDTNETDKGRANNRRTEFVVIKK